MVKLLLAWFQKAGRDLPWRKTSDPYAILLSEVMLQQTQVDRVIPKWRGFLKKFPTWKKLAAAPQSAVITLWHGLGYNRRALGLHALAKIVTNDFSGKLPQEKEALVDLPGIGSYTAEAVRAFAFKKEDAAPVDTNIERVLKRVFNAYKKDRKGIEELAESIRPSDVWSFNHAMMDLGATVCTARAPQCEECPLKNICAAYPCRGGEIKKVKQSPFADSDRFYRGRTISLLREHDVLRRNALARLLPLTDESRLTRILATLVKDGFILEKRGNISLK